MFCGPKTPRKAEGNIDRTTKESCSWSRGPYMQFLLPHWLKHSSKTWRVEILDLDSSWSPECF